MPVPTPRSKCWALLAHGVPALIWLLLEALSLVACDSCQHPDPPRVDLDLP